MSKEDKDSILHSRGIDRVLHVPFDEEIRGMSSEEFCDIILVKKLRAKHLVMGRGCEVWQRQAGHKSYKGIL